ncbi:MAG TPA: hypothetical protein K8W06_05355 [Limosilactobacillus coleohominis]|nr:hypothetical protein [Limosilactobacillus coleohominis]
MKRNGFLLGEHLLALGVLITGVTFFVITAHSMLCSNRQLEERLVAARLCKEYLYTGNVGYQSDYQLRQKKGSIIVSKDQQTILEIKKC